MGYAADSEVSRIRAEAAVMRAPPLPFSDLEGCLTGVDRGCLNSGMHLDICKI